MAEEKNEFIDLPGLGMWPVADADNPTEEELAEASRFRLEKEKEEAYVPIPPLDVGPDIKRARARPEPGFPAEFERFSKAIPLMPTMRPERETFSMAGGLIGQHVGRLGGPYGAYAGGAFGAGAGSMV